MSGSSIRIMCPNMKCRTLLSVPAIARGKSIRCGKCGNTMRVPAAPRPMTPTTAEAGDDKPTVE